MEINNLNMLIARAERSQPADGNASASGNLQSRQPALNDSGSSAESAKPRAMQSLVSSNFVKEQIETIINTFPPYFPAGSPQRIDLIKGVKAVQVEIKSSHLSSDTKDKLAGQQLTDASTDKEISTALTAIQQYTEKHSPSSAPATNKSRAGSIVSIEI
jgi:hypothetical protein